MSTETSCTFHRKSRDLSTGNGIGYCDLDGDWTVCGGEVDFCEKAAILGRYLLKKKRTEMVKKVNLSPA
jgi:hypothetical protein